MTTLSIDRFFCPSSELTKKLTLRMRDQSVDDLKHSLESVGGLHSENADGTIQDPWIDLLEAGNDRNLTSPEELAADQRWLSEILYGYLSRLAYSQVSPQYDFYDAVDAIPAGMASRLGLDESSDLELLKQFANDFQQWLSKCSGMTFVAGWGKIWVDSANPHRFGLERFSLPEEDELSAERKTRSANAGSGSSLLELAQRPSREIG